MVRSGKVIAQRLWHVPTEEDAARVLDPAKHGKGVVHTQLDVLRGNEICGLHSLVEVVCEDDLACCLDALPGDCLLGRTDSCSSSSFCTA